MDELDRLKQALAEDPAEPRAEAKRAALAAALAAYDAKKFEARQGSRFAARLRIAAQHAADILTGKTPMRTTHALAGGASLLVLTLAVMTAANLQQMQGFGQREEPASAPVGPVVRDLTQAAKDDDVATRVDAVEPAAPPPAREEAEALAGATADVRENAAPADLAAKMAAPATSTEGRSRVGAEPAQMAMPESSVVADLAMPQSAGEADLPAFSADMPVEIMPAPGYHDQGRDRFAAIETNPLKVTAEEPVSTFSIDVDTASYSFMRASLSDGVLPQDDAVRAEELINYFPYDYAGPESAEAPFKANVSVLATPWNADTKLLHIGIKGYDIAPTERPKANLVFLIDTSGSMEEPDKLPLVINSMKLFVDGLAVEDTVSIVTYAGSAGMVLEPTKGSDKAKILAALDNLMAGGSTAGAEGIRQAYQLARQNLDEDGVNRVILATDGDFNVGITDTDELQSFVERERETGVFLSVLGFGQGNYNDELMQALAQNGNGAAAYIDTLNEARKVMVEEAGSTMFPIAKDVKIQVEFNPVTVSEYRLIGYETRLLNREDFNNDKVDAGEIGSGHTVTALYEITPAGSPGALVDGLRYQAPAAAAGSAQDGEYRFLRIRYKLPDEDVSKLIETPISTADDVGTGGGPAAREGRFAAAVAAFAQILRGGRYTGDFDHDDVIALANANKGADEFGYRAEFVNLVRLAKSAASMQRQQP